MLDREELLQQQPIRLERDQLHALTQADDANPMLVTLYDNDFYYPLGLFNDGSDDSKGESSSSAAAIAAGLTDHDSTSGLTDALTRDLGKGLSLSLPEGDAAAQDPDLIRHYHQDLRGLPTRLLQNATLPHYMFNCESQDAHIKESQARGRYLVDTFAHITLQSARDMRLFAVPGQIKIHYEYDEAQGFRLQSLVIDSEDEAARKLLLDGLTKRKEAVELDSTLFAPIKNAPAGIVANWSVEDEGAAPPAVVKPRFLDRHTKLRALLHFMRDHKLRIATYLAVTLFVAVSLAVLVGLLVFMPGLFAGVPVLAGVAALLANSAVAAGPAILIGILYIKAGFFLGAVTGLVLTAVLDLVVAGARFVKTQLVSAVRGIGWQLHNLRQSGNAGYERNSSRAVLSADDLPSASTVRSEDEGTDLEQGPSLGFDPDGFDAIQSSTLSVSAS